MRNETRGFLDNLSIAKKTAVLVVIVTLGTLLIGAVAHFGVNSMKENYNRFYNQRFSTIKTLNKVREVYTTDIQRTLLNVKNPKQEIVKIIGYIDSSKEEGLLEWKNFLTLYYKGADKDDIEQQNMVDGLQEHIMMVNKLLDDSMLVLEKEGKETFAKMAYTPLLKSINLLDIKVSNLVAYHFRLATQQKDKIAKKYDETQLIVIVVTILVLLLSLLFTMMIAKNFQRLLYNLSRIVEKRNRENDKMQQLLEQRVNEAVEKAREKDHIMYQHARLASMGEMIGNIAHQWRQPLNALTLLIQSFGTKSISGKLDQSFIDKQVDEGLRLAVSMSDTIEDFRNFFSPSKEKEYFNVSKSIHDTLEMSSFFCKDENIDIRVLGDKDIKIYGYANEFSQVILNFINNARDNFKHREIHEDKKIEISIREVVDTEPHVEITFADNGGGIEEHIIDRVFEPYFTTKHKATGTGIGLYMSKQIIEAQMNGLVSVRNVQKEFDGKPYMCAEFQIVIPI
jgi:signal transduction histidine kinase